MEVIKRIKQNEVKLRDRNTLLRGTRSNNLSALHASFTERLKKHRVKPRSALAPALSAGRAQSYRARHIPHSPCAPACLYTRYSVCLSSFEPSTTARERAAAAGNPRAEDILHIDRRRDPPTASAAAFSSSTDAASHGTGTGTVQRYFIVDSTDALQKFGADAWERVACVITAGQAWKF
ncbi:hypothetical protein OG21DRAFT_1577055 [Imleria badia]|nr:hypothetical protein OG21DRAFT_1577055 [Imleria badia]